MAPYDGVLILGFGGPEQPEDVRPFLRRVAGGRDIPEERLDEVATHYLRFGGRSPLNDQARALGAALAAELAERGAPVPVWYGARNSAPYLVDTLREIHDSGARRVVTIVMSAYSSYSGCRQYREDLAVALAELAEEGRELAVDKVRPYPNLPGLTRTMADLLERSVREVAQGLDPAEWADRLRVAFVTHSIPTAMDETSGPGDSEGQAYVRQHLDTADALLAEVSERLGQEIAGELVFCSRSGPPTQPWLEPDINDHLTELRDQGVSHVAVAPIGFTSDHMEVVFDLDIEASQTASELGLTFVRVPTVSTASAFVAGLADLVVERAGEARGLVPDPTTWPPTPAWPSTCAPGCCPNLRRACPAVCGAD